MEPAYCESNTLVLGQQLKDGQYLASASGNYQLGFFSGSGRKRYVGIWHKQADAGKARTDEKPLLVLDYRGVSDYRRNLDYRNGYIRNIWNEQANERTNKKPQPVWVANRNSSIFDKSGIFTISNDGHLKILHNGGEDIVLFSVPLVNNTSATLLDMGNFVIHELNSDGCIKQVVCNSMFS